MYLRDLGATLNGRAVERLKRLAILLNWLVLKSSVIEATSGKLDVTAAVSDVRLFPMNGIVNVRCEGCVDTVRLPISGKNGMMR